MPRMNYNFKVLFKNTQKTSRQPSPKQHLKRNYLFHNKNTDFSEICLITLKSLFAGICGVAFVNLAKQQVHERKNQRGRKAE